ncbi:Na+/H+ antiporter NhaA [Streptomyces antarcticus]|uniref:Na+/H+ antiporter NhaA n=1 Tax=Streptomyces antarcticus TaxID=2996458 RepID=UPI00226F8387|nr:MULTISPECIES: Na+/H+ antiporter NhaA [unclassified Streptomyces]MCY0944148.1 Na+/H+ antiporter NhaA [Streptomyces sp. H34-AA3]MCZ4086742.1 Na+/H+ antiporter NhaA [Streptomyces sp. H34-S5]
MSSPRPRIVFGLMPWPERQAIASALRTETVGGMVLLAAAVIALIWANTPFSSVYEAIRDFHFGIPALGLDLSVGHWTADGLLAVFFLVAGIELKRELVVGELRTPATAALPVIAAVCGMVVPAALYALTAGLGGGSLDGWAVPMATDIAFALAVLAVISTHLPSALRAFLLTLAVVDDLGAILIIAVFFTSDLNLWALGGAFAGLAVFYLLQRYRVRGWWWYVPLGIAIWALMYNGGVHATVAGVAMGLILRTTRDKGESASPAARVSHVMHPISAGIAVPLFALFAAGVSISGPALTAVFTSPEPLGVVVGLVVGKILGIFIGTYLAARFTKAELNPDLAWADVLGLSVLAGIGFTVALLIGELAFPGTEVGEHVKAAVLVASLTAAVLAAVLLRRRNKIYRRLYEAENIDADNDGIPDIYQHTPAAEGPTARTDGQPT